MEQLETFIDEMIRRANERGYHPTAFESMRARWGTRDAIQRLVIQGDIQSGFRRLKEIGMLDWTIEAAVLRFPDLFDRGVREAAQFRLDQANA